MNNPLNKISFYTVAVICATLLSSGPVCMVYMISTFELNALPLLLLIPLTLLTLTALIITDKFLIPRFLSLDRFFSFSIYTLLLAILVEYLAIWIDVAFTSIFSLTPRIKDPLSPLTFVFAFIASLFLVLILFGIALWRLYQKRREQERYEIQLSRLLDKKTRLFRRRISMEAVNEHLDKAISLVADTPEEANRIIRKLSGYLRNSLYEPDHSSEENREPEADFPPVEESSRMVDFLTAPRFRIWRHLSLLLLMAVSASGMMFPAPDRFLIDPVSIRDAIGIFLTFTFITYINFYVVFPMFLRRGRQHLYAWLLFSIPLLVVLGITIWGINQNGMVNMRDIPIPWYVYPIGVAGTLLSIVFQMAGTASILLLKTNLKGRWRISRLMLETRQVEFETLKNQVNPHFLFNVLNNAGILSYDDPEEAMLILTELRNFLEYMLDDVERSDTSVAEEVALLKSFLTLERSSGRALKVSFSCPDALLNLRIPTLLLIPLVENAVKHSVAGECERFIEISFSLLNHHLNFICSNSALPAEFHPVNPNYPLSPASRRHSGLGLYNIRRRLRLLFGDDASLTTSLSDNIFKAIIKIPVEK
ncbi:MAG: histidine kinase [Muribaculaceae bacterium]|nr:histidine kinase [Muribaculaceae bacterium]